MSSSQPVFSATTPHFFAVILEETLQEKKLLICNKFARKYGKSLSNPILVKLPCGSEWKMEFTKHDAGGVYLQKGWLEFIDHYSLKKGHLLFFRYEGNSQFHVVICDRSAAEIDYPLVIPAHVEPKINGEQKVPKREEIEDDDSLEILDDKRMKASTPGVQIDISSHIRKDNQCRGKELGNSMSKEKLHGSNSEIEDDDSLEILDDKRMKPSTPGVQIDVSSHIRKDNQCHGKELGNSMSKEKLHGSNSEMRGKQSFSIELDGNQSAPSRKRKPEVIKCGKKLKKGEKFEALRKARGFNFENPSCKVVMQPSYICGVGLSLPSDFARRYLSNNLEKVTLRVLGGKRSWSATYTFGEYGSSVRAVLTGEWLAFARDNNLKVGDVCIFVLRGGIQASFDVVIFHENENSKASMATASVSAVEDGPIQEEPKGSRTNETEFGNSINDTSGSASNDETGTFSPKSKRSHKPSSNGSRALEAAREFYSAKPYFQVLLLNSHMNSIMNAPVASWGSYLKEKIQTVSLRVGERSWPVVLKVFQHQCLFCRGWAEFAKENSLCPGDVCVFVLIETDPVVLKVTIFREKERVILF
ncbi:hypothetical protein UlMin_039404 [Ulmus minor]